MFNPEKLLGGLMRSGMRGGGRGSLISGGAALGLVGVAMEAVEHYMNRPQEAAPQPPSASPPPGTAAPPPLPGLRQAAPPPPPPTAAVNAAESGSGDAAVLLIRAMIAAANADGVIDEQERTTILDRLKSVDLSDAEHQFIVHELLAPKGMQEIVAEVKTDEVAREVYAVSLIAIEVDTEAEIDYLNHLAANLGLDSAAINAIHRQYGIPLA